MLSLDAMRFKRTQCEMLLDDTGILVLYSVTNEIMGHIQPQRIDYNNCLRKLNKNKASQTAFSHH